MSRACFPLSLPMTESRMLRLTGGIDAVAVNGVAAAFKFQRPSLSVANQPRAAMGSAFQDSRRSFPCWAVDFHR